METSLAKPQKTLIVCSAFILGTVLSLLDSFCYLAVMTAIILTFFGFFYYRKDLPLSLIIISLAVYTFSLFYTGWRTPVPDEFFKLAPAELNFRGQVVSVPRPNMPGKTKFHFQANFFQEGEEWKPVNGTSMVYVYDDERKFEEIKVGDHLEVFGTVKLPFTAGNPGEFNYGKYLNRKGIFTMTFVRQGNYTILEAPGFSKWVLLEKLNNFRNKILNVHRKYLPSPKLELLGGMVFGDYAVPTPQYVEDDFKKSGLLHLLAASGLNVGIIFGIWYFLAMRARIAYRPTILTGMLLVAVYSFLTGLPPSVTRAALMMEFVLLGKLLDKKSDSAVLLVAVCALILLYNPMMATNVGFQLSFIVTLGLLMFIPPVVKKLEPIPEWLSGAILVPFVAQIFVAPIQIFHFNTFAIYSVLANIVVVPFVGIISFSGFVGSVFAFVPFIGEKICFLTDKIAEPFLSLLLFVSNYAAELPNSLQYLPKPSIEQIVVFYVFLFTFYAALMKDFTLKRLNTAVLVIFLSLAVFIFGSRVDFGKKLEFKFFNVGEGDSCLIKTPDNKYMLVDTGPYSKYSPMKMGIIPFFRDSGIEKLDALLFTHPDMDHTGGTTHLLKEINVEKVYNNGVTNDSKTSKYNRKAFERNGLVPVILKNGDEIKLDKNLKIQVIRPANLLKNDNNEDSLILYITYKDFSALLMGDCEAEALKDIQKFVHKPVNLIKVGHHGSYNSVNKEFMTAIKPEISIISVGEKGYRRNHPHPQVIKLLQKYSSKTFRTDKDLAVTIKTNGHNVKYKTFRDEEK